MKFIFRLVTGIIIQMIVFAVPLFAAAGTLRWPRAWILIGFVIAGSIITMILVFRNNEALLEERLKSPIQRGQPVSDKILVVCLLTTLIAWLVAIPLDVFRLHILPAAGPIASGVGLGLFALGWVAIALTFRENPYAALVVKDQSGRGQKVVDTGIYGIIRHPMYSGLLLYCVGMSLWLQSYASLALVALIAIVLAVRILFEERFLLAHLEGYAEYARRVRYRLAPFLW